MPPELIAQLISVLAPTLVPAIASIFRSHQAATGDLPTDDQVLATLKANIDAVIAEGAAWKASHPA